MNKIIILLITSIFGIESHKKIAIWADWGLECGVAEYSQHIFEALSKKDFPVIKYKHNISLKKIFNKVKSNKVKVLNIQHEPALFPDDKGLIYLVKDLKKAGVKVVSTIHHEDQRFSKFYESCDLCIYHTEPKFCSKKNYRLFNLPVPVFEANGISKSELREKYGFNNQDKIMVTTGFAVEAKRLPEILTKLIPYLKQDSKTKIQFLNSVSSRITEHCMIEVKKLNKIILDNNLENQVIFINSFLSEKELRERMFLSDVGFTWFNLKVNSISATEKEFVASRIPFVVNSNSHFDLDRGLIKTESNMHMFVSSIVKLLNNQSKLDQLSNEIEQIYELNNFDKKIKDFIKFL